MHHLTKPPFFLNPSPYRYQHRYQFLTNASNDNTNNNTTTNQETNTTKSPKKKKLKVKRRRNSTDSQEDQLLSLSASSPAKLERKERKKEWEEMTLSEKAIELYVGEKGALFWLNKFAYASIFIMAGIWILFRFVGPTVGLYQLDKPVLPPSSMFG